MRWLTRLITTAVLPAARRARPRRFRGAPVTTLALVLVAIGVALLPSGNSASAAPGDHLWSKRFGDAASQRPSGTAVDGMGNVLLSGGFEGSVDFGGGVLTSAGANDIFVAKFDSAGNHLWSKRFGDADSQAGGVTVDGTGNVLLSGGFEGSVDFGGGVLTSAGANDIFVAKFDPAGNHLWSKRFGDADSQGAGAAVDGTGNVFLSGAFQGSVDFGGGVLTSAGANDIFVAKFDPSGNHLWSKRFGDAESQIAPGSAVDGTGDVLLAGSFQGSVDFGGGALTSVGFSDIYIAKFDSAGNHLWSKRFVGWGASGTAVDGTGNVFLTGGIAGSADFGGGELTSESSENFFLAKFDPAGSHLWSKGFALLAGLTIFSGPPPTRVVVDSSGNVLLTGEFQGAARTSAAGR